MADLMAQDLAREMLPGYVNCIGVIKIKGMAFGKVLVKQIPVDGIYLVSVTAYLDGTVKAIKLHVQNIAGLSKKSIDHAPKAALVSPSRYKLIRSPDIQGAG